MRIKNNTDQSFSVATSMVMSDGKINETMDNQRLSEFNSQSHSPKKSEVLKH